RMAVRLTALRHADGAAGPGRWFLGWFLGSADWARRGRASNSSVAHKAHFLIRCASAWPGCGSLRNRCGESSLPRSSAWLHYEALLVAVEDQRPPANATCHVAQYHRSSSHMVSEPSPVSHRSQKIRASRRVTSALRASAARAVPQPGEP